jgi:hypothetical protein
MDQLRNFFAILQQHSTATGRFRGLLHLLIARKITLPSGEAVAGGMTWRALAAALKKYRWDREAVRELGIDPAELPPRDREKYWYLAITRANLSSAEAAKQAEELVDPCRLLGYVVSGPTSETKETAEPTQPTPEQPS